MAAVKRGTAGGATPSPKKPKKSAASADKVVLEGDATPRAAPAGDATSFELRVAYHNVGGLRALLKSEERRSALLAFLEKERPHVLCIGETKLQESHLRDVEVQLRELLPGHTAHWAVSVPPAKKGYSGLVALVEDSLHAQLPGGGPVGLASVVEGLGARSSGGTFEPFEREYNAEGRTLTLDMGSFALVCAYVPNSGADLVRLDYRIDVWEEDIKAHMAALGKPVVYMGDLNVAKSAGTTPREREAFGALLDAGYVDTFRALHPDARHAYTFWSVRARNRPWNRGLRLDYVLASANMAPVDGEGAPSQALPRVIDSWVGPEYNTNGDHCPVGATIALPSPK
eukprot:PRCOL_00006578-RA